jgi:hypothetical protein
MALSYQLGPNPKWYFVANNGQPLGDGYIVATSTLNPTQQMFIYQDPAGQEPYPTVAVPNTSLFGIQIDANGTKGPLYFQINSSDLTQTYDLEIYDSNGNLVWDIQGYLPSGSGGGGDVTEGVNFTNLIVNNTFWRAPINVPLVTATDLFLCPGAHSNFAASTIPGNQADIRFLKSNTAATDTITFIPFTQGGNILTGDITPPLFMRYICSNAGAGGETFKYVQFPISTDLESTSNQIVACSIWARANSGSNTINVQFMQFFGDGTGASAAQLSASNPITLTSAWGKFTFNIAIPTIASKTFGACQNTALYMVVNYPLSTTTSIDIVKLSSYLSPFIPQFDYLTNDQIDAVINAPRCGDIKISLNDFQPYGWVICNDGTIGNPSSNATTRANFDTFALFDKIWQTFVSNQTLAPMFNSASTPVAYGASSIADYEANNQISLTKVLGRALASQGQPSSGGQSISWPIGTAQGEELHSLTGAENGPHTHNVIGGGIVGSGQVLFNSNHTDLTSVTTSSGSGTGHNTIQPTAYFNVFIKL